MKNYINKFEVNGIEYNNTEIINNTIIGGENKALSAETGKKINEILTDNIISYTSLNNMTDMLITFQIQVICHMVQIVLVNHLHHGIQISLKSIIIKYIKYSYINLYMIETLVFINTKTSIHIYHHL
jgi:hypothetical protein